MFKILNKLVKSIGEVQLKSILSSCLKSGESDLHISPQYFGMCLRNARYNKNAAQPDIVKYYTVSHKKRATLFLIITLVFLGRFLYFLHQWWDEGILYTGVNKIYRFTLTVSPHYLIKLKRRINSTFWSQSSQCVRSNRLLATCSEICPMFFFSNSW